MMDILTEPRSTHCRKHRRLFSVDVVESRYDRFVPQFEANHQSTLEKLTNFHIVTQNWYCDGFLYVCIVCPMEAGKLTKKRKG